MSSSKSAPQLCGKSSDTTTDPVLPWMRVPVAVQAGTGVSLEDVHGIDQRLIESLKRDLKYRELFPVQSVVWRETAGGASTAHDMCIAAPTGSGKTLAYVLPVVNALSRPAGQALLHHLQALVVLPTRDLAAQVFQLLGVLCRRVCLKAALAGAKVILTDEAAELVGPAGSEFGGADIVVCTPGRLMAHLQSTPGFTLQHLRFLIVDETDRLLRQSYQEWLPHVLKALATQHSSLSFPAAGTVAASLPYASVRCVKIVVSATLTRDPAKLERLALHCPRYVATTNNTHRYHLPKSLKEFKLLCSTARKPLLLLALLQQLRGQPTIIFTSSLNTTHKLYLMLEAALENCNEVVEFSSLLPPHQRSTNLHNFKAGKASILVASDAMTRGMDIEGVHNVINYDAPVYAKTYVHRAGRTARAGRSGCVFTLLRDEDVWHFKQMIRKADNNYVKDYKIPAELVEQFRSRLDLALSQVQELLEAEAKQVPTGPPLRMASATKQQNAPTKTHLNETAKASDLIGESNPDPTIMHSTERELSPASQQQNTARKKRRVAD